jgi:hypothetical protein
MARRPFSVGSSKEYKENVRLDRRPPCSWAAPPRHHPGNRYAYYWYYDDCYVLTDDYGWVNICGYYTDRLTDGSADFLPGLLLA